MARDIVVNRIALALKQVQLQLMHGCIVTSDNHVLDEVYSMLLVTDSKSCIAQWMSKVHGNSFAPGAI